MGSDHPCRLYNYCNREEKFQQISSPHLPAMAAVPVAHILGPPNFHPKNNHTGFCYQICTSLNAISFSSPKPPFSVSLYPTKTSTSFTCSAANKPSPSTQISSTAKIRSEVLSPFRTFRMFFYLAFIASGGLGGLIAITQLIGALSNSSRAAEVPEILKGLAIDIGAVSVFGFLYFRDNKAKNAQVARLSREENLSNLKLRVDEKKVISINTFRGIARLVICAGPASFIEEAFRLSEPFTESLLDRGVLVVPFATDGNSPSFKFDESEELKEVTTKRKRLWQLSPVIVSDWSKWLDEQKQLANVPPESPVYLSLRMDGRVRGSGVGYPPWNAFVAQLPQVKGIWSGLLDGMDGRV